MFTFKNVSFKNILEIDDLSINGEEVTCIVGESGTGKSTLLKLMNHMISPTGGNLTFQDTPIHEIDPIELRRKVAMLPQTPVLFGETIKENLEAGLMFAEKPMATETEMEAVMETFYLSKGLNEKAETLSGGERQRLSIARMKLLNPDVILLDEPTSALDDALAFNIMSRFIDQAKATSKTVVFITHSKNIAEDFSDRIIDITPFSFIGGKK